MEDVIVAQLKNILAAFGLDVATQIKVLQAIIEALKPADPVSGEALVSMTNEERPAFLKTLARPVLDSLFLHFFPHGHPEMIDTASLRIFVDAAATKVKANG
jgi:hypothetical protein